MPAGPVAYDLHETLKEHDVRYVRKQVHKGKNQAFWFKIDSLVRTRYQFIADTDREKITVNIIYYDSLRQQRNQFSPEQITPELMGALTRHVIREDNDYDEMAGNVMTDEMKTALRTKLQVEEAQKRKHEQATEKAKPKRGLFGFFGKK